MQKPIGCIVFDLNNLKVANDTLGHSVGDQLIENFARLLRNAIPAQNFVGRYGGDEFTIICEAASEEELIQISSSINSILSEKSKDLPYSLSLSIGIAEYSEDMKSAQAFIAAADQRLYEAKNAKKKLTKKKHA